MKYMQKLPVAQPGNGNGHGNGDDKNGHGPTKVVTGRNLAHGRRTKTQRAFLALDFARGDAAFVKPTLTQAAKLADVNLDYVMKASRLSGAQRLAVEAGRRAIYDPPAAAAICDENWAAMSAAERQQWARDHAPELWSAFDAVTAPQPTAEKTRLRFTDAELFEGLGYDPFAEVDPADPLLPEGM